LTDVIMPNINGKELADMFHKEYPEAKVIFISGYTDETITKHGILEACDIFIQKPVSTSMLVIKLRELLDVK